MIKIKKTFIEFTNTFIQYLTKIKQQCLYFDSQKPTKTDQILFINSIKNNVFTTITTHYQFLYKMLYRFNQQTLNQYKQYYQNKLQPLLATPPLNKRIYERPLGYAGDFIIMQHYYNDSFEGNNTYEKLIHRYTLELPVSRANINRRNFFKQKIFNIINRANSQPYIASFGCGPAVEIFDLLESYNLNKPFYFYCFDSEILALNFIKNKYNKLSKDKKEKIKIIYKQMNILDLIKGRILDTNLPPMDYIYASGLFDYFSNKTASLILKSMYKLLNKKASLTIVNVVKNHNAIAYMEILGNWYLNLRNERDMINLTHKLNDKFYMTIKYDFETKKNIYLNIQKI